MSMVGVRGHGGGTCLCLAPRTSLPRGRHPHKKLVALEGRIGKTMSTPRNKNKDTGNHTHTSSMTASSTINVGPFQRIDCTGGDNGTFPLL